MHMCLYCQEPTQSIFSSYLDICGLAWNKSDTEYWQDLFAMRKSHTDRLDVCFYLKSLSLKKIEVFYNQVLKHSDHTIISIIILSIGLYRGDKPVQPHPYHQPLPKTATRY